MMQSHFKRLLHAILPPLIFKFIRNSFGPKPMVSWSSPLSPQELNQIPADGYSSEDFRKKLESACISLTRNPDLFERDTVLFDSPQIAWELVTGILMIHAKTGGPLRIMDFGGSIGSAYRNHMHLFKDIPIEAWNVIDQEFVVEMGKKYFAGPLPRFEKDYKNIIHSTNTILFGSSLQYLQYPYSLLDELGFSSAQFMLIDRTPVHSGGEDQIRMQTVHAPIYEAMYPCRVFSKSKLEQHLEKKWQPLLLWENRESVSPFFTLRGGLYEKRS